MTDEALVALAQFAGQTVAAAAITDAWESIRGRFAQLLGRGDVRRTEVAELRLAKTREQLTAPGTELERARSAQARQWVVRFTDLLEEEPGIEAELRNLAEEVAAGLPAGTVQTSDHSVAAKRDVNISASNESVAAGVIHGNVELPNPTQPDSAGM